MLPDVTVPFYSADYYARHDPFLAAALSDATPQAAPKPGPVAVLNAATFRPDKPVAPGSLATLFGDFPDVPSTDATAIPLPRQLSGVEVLIDSVAAALIAVRPGQINFQVPPETAIGQAAVRVRRNGAEIASGTVIVESSAPGIFVANSLDLARPGAILDENSRLLTDASPARRGSVIQIYATGQGNTSDLTRVYIGAELADVLFSGPQPSFPGLWQINARVPDTAALSGQAPVFVVIGSNASNAVTMKVGNAQ